jgi:hypothetical protein
VQIGMLCAFHTCFASDVDMQARKILQEQEEYFSGCSEMFVKTIRK